MDHAAIRGEFRRISLRFAVILISPNVSNLTESKADIPSTCRVITLPPKWCRKPFFFCFTTVTSCHASVCSDSGRKVTSRQLKLVAQLVNPQLAGRVSLTGKSSVIFFLFCFFTPLCLKQVKAGPLHLLPSLCYSLRAPPGRLVFYHHNYPFCCWLTHIRTTITVGVRKHRAHIVQVSYMYM